MLVKGSEALIRFYRRIAPERVRQSCRFTPTCSEYAVLALRKHGFFKGWSMALKRLLRCKPPNGGIDYP